MLLAREGFKSLLLQHNEVNQLVLCVAAADVATQRDGPHLALTLYRQLQADVACDDEVLHGLRASHPSPDLGLNLERFLLDLYELGDKVRVGEPLTLQRFLALFRQVRFEEGLLRWEEREGRLVGEVVGALRPDTLEPVLVSVSASVGSLGENVRQGHAGVVSASREVACSLRAHVRVQLRVLALAVWVYRDAVESHAIPPS